MKKKKKTARRKISPWKKLTGKGFDNSFSQLMSISMALIFMLTLSVMAIDATKAGTDISTAFFKPVKKQVKVVQVKGYEVKMAMQPNLNLEADIDDVSVDPDPITFTDVEAVSISHSSATIIWDSSIINTGYVRYGTVDTASGRNMTAQSSSLTDVNHSVPLTGLTGETTYYYRIVAYPNTASEVESSSYSFTTLADPADFTFDNISVTSNNDGTAKVSWTTDVANKYPSVNWYEVGSDEEYWHNIGRTHNDVQTEHEITLGNDDAWQLNHGSTYMYQVCNALTEGVPNTCSSDRRFVYANVLDEDDDPDDTIGPPTVALTLGYNEVIPNQEFRVRVLGEAEAGLASVWWFVEDVDNRDFHTITGTVNGNGVNLAAAQNFGAGNGLNEYEYKDIVTVADPGTYEFIANARDLLYPVPGEAHQASEGAGMARATLVVKEKTDDPVITGDKVKVCHYNRGKKTYSLIKVNQNAWDNGHQYHDGDFITTNDMCVRPSIQPAPVDDSGPIIDQLRQRIKDLKYQISQFEQQVVKREKALLKRIDNLITERVKGWILLQVEGKGEAWYVDHDSGQRYYLRDGNSAYQALQAFGLGISNADLDNIPLGLKDEFVDTDSDNDGLSDKLEESLGTDPSDPDSDDDGFNDGDEIKAGYSALGPNRLKHSQSFANLLKGRIVLQVEDKGQAWYIHPEDGKRYYMKDGPQAYNIMRFLSLGATDSDLQKVDVGDLDA